MNSKVGDITHASRAEALLSMSTEVRALRRQAYDAQRAVLHRYMELDHDPIAAKRVLEVLGIAEVVQ